MLLLQQGKTRTNNQVVDIDQEFEMYEPRSRRERTPSKKKIPMDEATYIERYLTSWIPHTLTFLSRCVSFFVLQFFPKPHFKKNCKLRAPFSHLIRPRHAFKAHLSRKGSREARARLASRARCGPRMWHLSPVYGVDVQRYVDTCAWRASRLRSLLIWC